MELLVLFRPERQQTGPDKRYGAGQLQVVWDTVNSFTVAHGLLATPLQGVQTHLGPWTSQHVARLAKEVDFMSNTKHLAQSATMSEGLWFGAGRWKQTEITITSPDQGVISKFSFLGCWQITAHLIMTLKGPYGVWTRCDQL